MIGWALTQLDTKGAHLPISFGSRCQQQHEENQPVSTLERIAVVEGYKDVRYIVHGKKLTIFCDNKPTIHNATSHQGPVFHSLKGILSESNTTIEYLEGKQNILGDFMSRYYAPKTKAAVHIVSSSDGKEPIDIDNLQEVQQDNDDIQETIRAIAEGKDILRAPYSRMKQHLFVSHGALYVRHN